MNKIASSFSWVLGQVIYLVIIHSLIFISAASRLVRDQRHSRFVFNFVDQSEVLNCTEWMESALCLCAVPSTVRGYVVVHWDERNFKYHRTTACSMRLRFKAIPNHTIQRLLVRSVRSKASVLRCLRVCAMRVYASRLPTV